jgi:hypothetical protein
MKPEKTSELPAMNLFRPEDAREMVDSKEVTKVWLTNGKEFEVIPGTFHYFVTKGDRPQPFIQFQYEEWVGSPMKGESKVFTVEVFPVSMAGVGYLTEETDSE